MKFLISLLRSAFGGWVDNNAASLSAALAFYTIFSLVPLLIVIIAIAGFAFSRTGAEQQVFNEIGGLVGRQSADFVRDLSQAGGPKDSNLLAFIIGAVTLLFGASGVFGHVQYSLDIIWKTPERRKRGWLRALRNKLLSFAAVVIIGFLLLMSLLASALFGTLGQYIPIEPKLLLQLLNIIFSFVGAGLLFLLMYRFLPNARVSWYDSLVGALFTAILFIIGRLLIGLFLGSGAIASAYGPAASLVLLLLWIYYSAQIFYFGAEFTHAYAKRPGNILKQLTGR